MYFIGVMGIFRIYFFKQLYLFNFWLCLVFIASGLFSGCGEWGLLSIFCSWTYHCGGFPCCGAWTLGCAGFSSCGSWVLEYRLVVVMLGLIFSTACGILPDQGSNPCLLHYQADSLPLSYQESSHSHVASIPRRRQWHPTPVLLPGESRGWRSLVGCRLWSHRVGHDWCDLVAAASIPNYPRYPFPFFLNNKIPNVSASRIRTTLPNLPCS